MSNKQKNDTMEKEDVVEESNTREKARPKRKKTYERVRELSIPEDVKEQFRKDNCGLRWVACMVDGDVDLRSLSKRESEGYEFVAPSELPEHYRARFETRDLPRHKNVVMHMDVCLMKADLDLMADRDRYFSKEASNLYKASDLFTKGRGFVDRGSKSTVSNKEPSFD